MAKSRPVALVITHQRNSRAIVRLRNLAEVLGPIKARTFRQTSRIANTLKAGFPVHNYEELAGACVLLICAAEDELADLLHGMEAAGFPWERKTVILCAGDQQSDLLADPGARGAAVGSMALVDDGGDLRYFVEGDRAALRVMKRMVEASGGRVVPVKRAGQYLCEAAIGFASWLMLPAADASMRCLRLAGLTPGKAAPLVERAIERSLRAYLKGGRRAWKPPSTAREKRAFLRRVEALREKDPALAEFLIESARVSLRRAGREVGWIECAEPRVKKAAAGA